MYNWNHLNNNHKTPPSLSNFSMLPKNFSLRMRGHRLINQLPVIEEESDDKEETELKNFSNFKLKENYKNRKTINILQNILANNENEAKNKKRVRENVNKPLTKLPPLVNINCMMNPDVKQSHIWDTNFGKRLLNPKTDDLPKSDASKPVRKNFKKNSKSFLNKIPKNGAGDDEVKIRKQISSKIKSKNSKEKPILSKSKIALVQSPATEKNIQPNLKFDLKKSSKDKNKNHLFES